MRGGGMLDKVVRGTAYRLDDHHITSHGYIRTSGRHTQDSPDGAVNPSTPPPRHHVNTGTPVRGTRIVDDWRKSQELGK